MSLLTTSTLWIAAALLLGLGPFVAMLATYFVRKRVALQKLRANNEVAGFKFATVGVLYAVLLAFAVLVVWEKLNDAESNVAMEAGAATTLFRLANGMEPDSRAALEAATTAYLGSAIEDDWPAMAQGGESAATIAALGDVYSALLAHEPVDETGAIILAEGLRQADLLTQARRARIVVAAGIVPGVIWLVLFVGAFITIGFTLFFGTENLKAQALMTGALAFLIFSGLLVIVAVDRPFAGSVKVEPEALRMVLEDFGG